MAAGKSAAVALWWLLETDAPIPHGTGHIVVDGRLCGVIARSVGLPADLLYEVFWGVPVKEVRAIVGWALRAPEEERLRALKNWRRRRDERESMKKGVA